MKALAPTAILLSCASLLQAATTTRYRVVVSTDFPPLDVCISGCAADHSSDPDDVQSMVRFLLHSNELDVEALVASAATYANVAKKQNILDILDVYSKVYDNLRSYDANYPTPAYLKSVTFQGRSGTWGKTVGENTGSGKDSEASDAIIKIVDKADPRPVWFSVWGDLSNIAQAIWKVKNTRSDAEFKTFIGKMRIHQIAHQDGTIDWLLNDFPDLFIIYSKTTYQGMFGGSDALSNTAWIDANIRNNHGPLGAVYPPRGIGSTGVCEGDTPSFLSLLSATRGLNDPEDPTQPSWGGQFTRQGSTKHYVDGVGGSSISKWRSQYQSEFAKLADRMVKPSSTGIDERTTERAGISARSIGSRIELAVVAPRDGLARLQAVSLDGSVAASTELRVSAGRSLPATLDLAGTARGILVVRMAIDGIDAGSTRVVAGR